jgi:hypothetical protein
MPPAGTQASIHAGQRAVKHDHHAPRRPPARRFHREEGGMATTRMESPSRADSLGGWALFAAIILVIAGGLNIINGLAAINHGSYYGSQVMFGSLRTWGWIMLIAGIVQLAAGLMVFARNIYGYYIGVVVAMLGVFVWFFLMFSAPIPALIAVITNFLIMYGLTVGSTDVA